MSSQSNSGPAGSEQAAASRLRATVDRLLGPDWPWIGAVLLIAFIAAWPAISQPGLLNTRGGGDSPFLLQRLHQLATALADGHFPARWMPDANYGYGYPFYNYYAPLSLYVAAAFRFVGFSFVRAIHLAQLAGFIVAGLGMFHLGRRWLGSRWAGLLAAAAYTFAPFHMVNVYTRGDSLAEFWAMAFYPLILLAADRLLIAIATANEQGSRREGEKGREAGEVRRALALFALAYAALILSHNISALIFSPFLLLYLMVRPFMVTARKGRKGEREQGSEEDTPAPLLPLSSSPPTLLAYSLIAFAGLLLAFALAAWFFVPALAEQGLAQLGPVTEGYFHYSNHFRGLDLIQRGLLFDYNPDGGVAFRLGLVQAGLALGGAVVLLWRLKMGRKGEREKGRKIVGDDSSFIIRHWLFVIISTLVAIFMITPLSRLLWDHLPLLPFTQFPWRFLSVASFFMALLAGAVVLAAERPAARAAVAVAGGLVLLAAGLLGLRVDHLILTDADVTAERLAQYEWFTGNIGTTVSAEYLTPESSPRPWASAWLNAAERDRVVALSGELTAELAEREATRQTWRVAAGPGGAAARFPTMQWPGWRAAVDGQPVEITAVASSGLMAVTIPEGEHTVTLELGRTPARLAAELVSLAAGALAVLLMIGRHPRPRSFRGLPSAAGGLFLLAALALLWRGDPTDLPRGDLTWDFAQMGYLHHTPGGIPFSDGSRLYEYGYSGDTIVAGRPLTVTLSFATGEAGAATLALLTPASARPTANNVAAPPVFAEQRVTLSGEAAVFTLPLSPATPAGLYVPRLILEGARPLTPSGATRGDLFLRPIRVTTSGIAPAAQTPGIVFRTVDILPRGPDALDGRFVWQADAPFAGRYQLSWRAQNGDGVALSQTDAQPGYGFNPTDGWPAGEPVYDWLSLRLPNALTGPPPYPLVMTLYDATTGEQLLVRRVGELVAGDDGPTYQPIAPVFAPPVGIAPIEVTFGHDNRELIRLRGYETAQTEGVLSVTLHWEALGDIPGDFTRFVHLLDPSGAVVAQVDSQPVANSYPTGQWLPGEFVADTARLDVSALPEGEYRLAVGFYRPVEGLPRLDAAAPGGPLADGRALLPEIITLPAE